MVQVQSTTWCARTMPGNNSYIITASTDEYIVVVLCQPLSLTRHWMGRLHLYCCQRRGMLYCSRFAYRSSQWIGRSTSGLRPCSGHCPWITGRPFTVPCNDEVHFGCNAWHKNTQNKSRKWFTAWHTTPKYQTHIIEKSQQTHLFPKARPN